MLDTKSLSLEGIAGVILVVGLASAYFLGGNLSGTSESNQRGAVLQNTPKEAAGAGKKGKKKRTPAVHQSVPATELPRLPGGNEAFTGPMVTELEQEDPALVAASIQAGAAAQDHRAKAKKAKKKAKNSAAAPADITSTRSPSVVKPTRSKRPSTQIITPDVDQDEGKWRVVGRKTKINTTDSTASYSTTSATDPSSPKEEIPPAPSLESSEIQHRKGPTSSNGELDAGVEPAPSSLLDSREFGATSEDAAAESTEDDGFIAVNRGRRRTQRTASISSVGGGSSVRSPESLTKRQRQNQAKREAQKMVKAEAQEQQMKTLRAHQKELEKVRIGELHKKGKQLSGGMSMSVGGSGKAEWE